MLILWSVIVVGNMGRFCLIHLWGTIREKDSKFEISAFPRVKWQVNKLWLQFFLSVPFDYDLSGCLVFGVATIRLGYLLMIRDENLQICSDTLTIPKHESQRSISLEAGHFVRGKRVSKNMDLVASVLTKHRVLVILRDHHLQQQVHLLDLACRFFYRNRWLLLLVAHLLLAAKSTLLVSNPEIDGRKLIH